MQTARFESDAPVDERSLQLEAPAADVAQVAAEQTKLAIVGDGVPGLLNLLLIHQYASGKNHGLRPLSRWHQPTLHQKNVNSFLHDSLFLRVWMAAVPYTHEDVLLGLAA